MKANEIKKGMVFNVDGKNILVKKVFVQDPHSRGGSTLYKVTGSDISSGQKFERSFKGDEQVDSVDISKQPVQLLFKDADGFTFMDTETYEQFTLSEDAVEDESDFLTDGIEGVTALTSDGMILSIEIPTTLVMEIMECAPAMKSASSSARTKPATMSTGLVIQVPEYLTIGEKIKINTESREFMSRA